MFLSSYFTAGFALIVYTIISTAIFVWSIAQKNSYVAFVIPTVFGMFASYMFLYIFSHDEFFTIAKHIKKRKEKTEQKWLDLFIRYGRFPAVLAIGFLAGPIFAGLSARLLIPDYKYKYLLVTFIIVPPSLLSIAAARGLISFL